MLGMCHEWKICIFGHPQKPGVHEGRRSRAKYIILIGKLKPNHVLTVIMKHSLPQNTVPKKKTRVEKDSRPWKIVASLAKNDECKS